MVKKIKKYLKFVVCCTLIMSLVAPSYAALSASDGSAFVTKAEFDSALADFNARLTTFEAGINSKIDSQVTSYLDRNGIWNGAAQEFWDVRTDTDPIFTSPKEMVEGWDDGENHVLAKIDTSSTHWSVFCGAGNDAGVPLIKNVTKSGLLAYNIPAMWFTGNSNSYNGNDICLTFVQTDYSNLKEIKSATSIHIYDMNSLLRSPKTGLKISDLTIAVPYWIQLKDKTKADYFTLNFTPVWLYTSLAPQRIINSYEGSGSKTIAVKGDATAGYYIYMKDIFYEYKSTNIDGEGTDSYSYRTYATPKNYVNNDYPVWSGNYDAGTLQLATGTSPVYNVTIFSGYTFVSKNKALLLCPGSGGGWFWTSKTTPVSSSWLRTSGELLKLDVY